MSGFIQSWNSSNEFRNILLCTWSVISFILLFIFKEQHNVTDQNYLYAYYISIIFCIFVFTLSCLELTMNVQTFGNFIFMVCIWILGISLIITTITKDTNIIVASTTILLVIITGYSVKTTNEIAQRQLQIQNDPLITLSLKENENQVQIIDLIIENVGNGLARNVQFSIVPRGFISLSGDPLERLYFFQRGIEILPSKQKIIIHLVNFAKKVQDVRDRLHLPASDAQLTPEEAQFFRRTVRDESELQITVVFENIDGEQKRMTFNFNLCFFWGLRFPRRPYV